jgi:hypothetical protein
MAEITIAEIIQHNIITAGDILESAEKQTFVRSGIFGADSDIQSAISGMKKGTTVEVDYLVEPDFIEPEYGDDSDVDIIPQNIGEQMFRAAVMFPNVAFQEKSIVKVLRAHASENDGLQALVDYIAKYWDKYKQRHAFAMIQGLIADNIANDASDLIEVVAAPFNFDSAVDALEKRGDSMVDQMDHIFMNSKVYASRVKAGQIATIQEENTGVFINTWNGMRVHVDNILKPVGGKSLTIFAKSGAFVEANIDIDAVGLMSLEYERDAKKGHGAGSTSIVSRTGGLWHPSGWDYTKATQANPTRNLAETGLEANWDRKIAAAQSPFVVVESQEA